VGPLHVDRVGGPTDREPAIVMSDVAARTDQDEVGRLVTATVLAMNDVVDLEAS
jgi:hypothetical protein